MPNPETTAPAVLTAEYYLEAVIWQDAAEGEHMTAAEVYRRMAQATPGQLYRAQEMQHAR